MKKLTKKQNEIKESLKVAIINKVKQDLSTQEVINTLVESKKEGWLIIESLGLDFIDSTKEWKVLKTQVTNAFNNLKMNLTINKVKQADGTKIASIEEKQQKPDSLKKAEEDKKKEKEEELFFVFLDWFRTQDSGTRNQVIADLQMTHKSELEIERKQLQKVA